MFKHIAHTGKFVIRKNKISIFPYVNNIEFMNEYRRKLTETGTGFNNNAHIILKDKLRDLNYIYKTPYDKELCYLVANMSHIFVYRYKDNTVVVKSLSEDSVIIKNNIARYNINKYVRAIYHPLNMITVASIHGLIRGVISMYVYFAVKFVYISTITLVVITQNSN